MLFLCFFFYFLFCFGPKKIEESQNVSLNEGDIVSKLKETPQETLVPTKWDVGDTTVSNEDRLDLLIPHVQKFRKRLRWSWFGTKSYNCCLG